ncbi:hypothetical protein T02_13072 [Trichinella nativa]|uniref:Uncharacterized protein n=1 Tax=Trichinella nativa TaxID=6335 RepID=A0A0V1LNG7_9BILA|nr:hypothetical protein T06_14368 [Trichinella sp. T6]KRZ61021.1 hypothetical protein T02_13072 [Trichinella nativa]
MEAKRLCKEVRQKVEIEEKAEAEVGKENKKKKKINKQQTFRTTAFASLSGDVGACTTVAVHLVKCCRLERERILTSSCEPKRSVVWRSAWQVIITELCSTTPPTSVWMKVQKIWSHFLRGCYRRAIEQLKAKCLRVVYEYLRAIQPTIHLLLNHFYCEMLTFEKFNMPHYEYSIHHDFQA